MALIKNRLPDFVRNGITRVTSRTSLSLLSSRFLASFLFAWSSPRVEGKKGKVEESRIEDVAGSYS